MPVGWSDVSGENPLAVATNAPPTCQRPLTCLLHELITESRMIRNITQLGYGTSWTMNSRLWIIPVFWRRRCLPKGVLNGRSLIFVPPALRREVNRHMQKGHSTHPESPYMTVQEVADFLRVHTMTVYGLLGAGKLAGIRTMGARGHWRISRETVLGLSSGASSEP